MKRRQVQQSMEDVQPREDARVRISLIAAAAEAILQATIQCAKEVDADKQLKQAQALTMLTESLVKFEFRVERQL